MKLAGGRKTMFSSLVVMLIIFSALHIWVCCDCKAGASRIFPGHGMAKLKENYGSSDSRSKDELFRKFFNGGRTASDFNNSGKGLEETKRRVPSCPDPLHNK